MAENFKIQELLREIDEQESNHLKFMCMHSNLILEFQDLDETELMDLLQSQTTIKSPSSISKNYYCSYR